MHICGGTLRRLEEGDPGGPHPLTTTTGPRATHLHLRPLSQASPPDGVELSPPGLQKKELASKNPKDASKASRLPLGQPLIQPEKRASSTSSNEYEGESQTGVLTLTRNPHCPDDEIPLISELSQVG